MDKIENMESMEERRPMTRAEWVKQARMECERNLEYTPRRIIEESNERFMEPGEPITRSLQGRLVQGKLIQGEEVPTNSTKVFSKGIRELMQEDEPQEPLSQQTSKISFQTIKSKMLLVQIGVAVAAAIFIISIDFFHIKAGYIHGESMRETISNNTSIDTLETSVSTFIKDKIIPVFQNKENTDDTNQTNDSSGSDAEETADTNTDTNTNVDTNANTDTNTSTGTNGNTITNQAGAENENGAASQENQKVGIIDKDSGVTKPKTSN